MTEPAPARNTVSWVRTFQVFIALAAFISVLDDPLARFFTASQVLLIGAGVLSVVVIYLQTGTIPVPRLTLYLTGLLGLLIGQYLLATLMALSVGSPVDLTQGVRDLRDLLGFTVGACLLSIGCARLRVSVTRPLVLGLSLAMLLEIMFRGTTVYPVLFIPPFDGIRPQAGFLGPNEYGALGSIVFAMALGYVLTAHRRWEILLYTVMALVPAAVTLSTLSRGSLLGLGFSAVVLVGVWTWDTVRDEGVRGLVRATGLLAALGLGIIAVGVTVVRRYRPLLQFIEVRTAASSVAGGIGDRVDLVQSAWGIGELHPLLGAGLGGFAAQNADFGGTGTLSPHMEVAKAFAEGGVISAIITIGVFVVLLLVAFQRRKAVDGYPLLGGMLAFLVAEQLFTYLVRPTLSTVVVLLVAALAVPPAARSHLARSSSVLGTSGGST